MGGSESMLISSYVKDNRSESFFLKWLQHFKIFFIIFKNRWFLKKQISYKGIVQF